MEKKPRTPRFDEYLAGAFFSYTLAMIPILILSFILQLNSIEISFLDSSILVSLVIITNLFSGFVSGFLVVRRSEADHLIVGIKTGIGSIL
jgi:putative membrane protein (TIGR04086 family)